MITPSSKHIRNATSFAAFLKKHYRDSVDTFFDQLTPIADNLIRTDINKSGQFINSLSSLDNFLPDKYRAHLYRIRGRHYHLSGDYANAYQWYIRAENSFYKLKDYLNRAKIQKALMDVLIYRGNKEEALRIGRRALHYFRRTGLVVDYAQVLTNIGNLYHRLDNNKTALSYYDKAFKVFRHRQNKYAIALIQFNRANVLANMNQIHKAEKLYKISAEIYKSINMELFACQADYSLAYISFLKGEYSQALKEFAEVARKFSALGDKRCVALAELDSSEINLHLNLYGQVIDDASDIAGDFKRLNMSYEQAKALYFSAEAYFAHGDYERVNQLLKKAIGLFTRSNVHWYMACRFLEARLDMCEKRVAPALKSLRQISRYYKATGNMRKYYDVRLAHLDGLINSNNRTSASRLINSLSDSLTEMAGYQKYLFFTLAGDYYAGRDDTGYAAIMYRRAMATAEILQLNIFPYEMRRFYWIDKLSVYEKLVSLYLTQKKYKQAFHTLNRGKMILLGNNSSFEARKYKSRFSSELWDEYKSLKAFLRKALMPVGAVSLERTLENNRIIHDAERKIWKINRSLLKTGDIKPDNIRQNDLASIQDRLSDNEVLIQYAVRNKLPGAFIISEHTSQFIPLASDMNSVMKLLRHFYFTIVKSIYGPRDNQITKSILGQISNSIWRNIECRLPDSITLSIVPDGYLSRIPFSALNSNNGQLLIEKYPIRILPASSFLSKGSISRALLNKVNVFAVADDNLPGIKSEKDIIQKHFPESIVFADHGANSRQLRRSLQIANGLVHIAAHASQSYENELFSKILLADGPLYTFDIYSCNIKSRLVVLSGCQTGDPGLFYKGNTTSLAQSFLFSGAKAVAGSYWPISDDITSVFMDFLYGRLKVGTNCGYALRNAILDMRSLTDDIRHWASFYLLGQG